MRTLAYKAPSRMTNGSPALRGAGSATVEPIRSKNDINAVKGVLANRTRDLTLFTLGIHFGLRANDLLHLRWADVLNDAGRAIADEVFVTETKTGKMRKIVISENARDALERYRKDQRQVEPNAFLFPNKGGKPLSRQWLHRLVNKWTKEANVKGHFGSHTLRKTYGYHLHEIGYDIALLMKVFGHSSQAITLRYIGIEQRQIDEANLKLNL